MDKTVLLPPRYFSHENLEFGNIIKVNFEPIENAIGYIIQKSNDNEINFETFTFTNENSFVDYTIDKFSDYNKEIFVHYKVCPIASLEDTSNHYSRSYKVVIPRMPAALVNSIEGKPETHSKIFNIVNNKETKFLIQDIENNLGVYKTSVLTSEVENNVRESKLLGDTSRPLKVISPSTDEGFYIQYASGTIQYIDKVSLFPLITLNTYGKNLTHFEVNNDNDLIVLIEETEKQKIIVYEKNNFFIKEIPVLNQEQIFKERILDIKIRKNDIYVVDEKSNFYVFNFDINYGTLKLKHKFFNTVNFVPFSIFKKKAYQFKNIIVDFVNHYDQLTLIERELFKTSFLNNPKLDKKIDEIEKLIKESSTSTNNDYVLFSAKLMALLSELFQEFELNKKSKLTKEKLDQLVQDIINSNNIEFGIKRVFNCLEKYNRYNNEYLTNTKILFSEINNIIILSSPFYFYIFDLYNYRMNSYFNTLIPNKELPNYLLDELEIPVAEYNAELRALESLKTDRFICDIKFENGKVGFYFEDILSYYTMSDSNEIVITNDFSNKYIDFYNLDYKGNYTDLIINSEYNDLFTELKGFGYDYIKQYSVNSSIFKSDILVKANKFYQVKKDSFFFERILTEEEQFKKELADGTLKEIDKSMINHFSLNTRLNLTSKEVVYDSKRDFSFFGVEQTVTFDSVVQKPWLNKKKIFKSNLLKNKDFEFYFDNTAENVFVYTNDNTFFQKRSSACCLFLIDKFYLESNNIIFNEEVNIKRSNFMGKITRQPICTEEQFYFLFTKEKDGEEFVFYQNVYDFNEATDINGIKIKSNIIRPNYFLIDALYKAKKVDPEAAQLNYFWIYNDYQENDKVTVAFGNDRIPTWRWKRNIDLLKYDNYLGFRVSINKKDWTYLNKDVYSYTSNEELNDGVHTFYLQFQDQNGVWSKSIKNIYNLKTLKPAQPILEEIYFDTKERGKPLIKWVFDKEIVKYKVIYDSKLEYYPVEQNYHSPQVSFDKINEPAKNIKVEVIAFDKYKNESEKAVFWFLNNNTSKDLFNLYYYKYTANPKPLIRWEFNKKTNIKNYYYSFNDEEYKETNFLFASPSEDLKEGINKFKIYGVDILDSKTEIKTIYFEVKLSNKVIPKIKKESYEKNLITTKKDLVIELELESVDNQLIYSFDNFKNLNLFKDYKIDLRKENLKIGNHTIYIKYKDKFGNYSEVTEYTFRVIDDLVLPVTLYDNFINYNYANPKIKWYKRNEHDSYLITLYKEDLLYFEEFKINSNYYQPLHELSNGKYKIIIKAVDKYKSVSKPIEYSFSINTSIPSEVRITNFNISNNQLYLSVESKEQPMYKFKNINSAHITNYTEFNKELILNNLVKGQKYELNLVNKNKEGFNSKEITYLFEYIDNTKNSKLELQNSVLEFEYDKINKEINLISFGDTKDFLIEKNDSEIHFYKDENVFLLN